jgi:hypothetical protein
MKKVFSVSIAVFAMVILSLAAPRPAAAATFTGNISDSMCGLKHNMPGSAKDCTIECVKMGATYVLADEANQKVYKLSDQKAAAKFAGENVTVTGTLKGDKIKVTSIVAAK